MPGSAFSFWCSYCCISLCLSLVQSIIGRVLMSTHEPSSHFFILSKMKNSVLFECTWVNAPVKHTKESLCITCLFTATTFKIAILLSIGLNCIEKSVHFLIKQHELGLTSLHRSLSNIDRRKRKKPWSTYGRDQLKAKKLGFSHLCWAAFHLRAYGTRQIFLLHITRKGVTNSNGPKSVGGKRRLCHSRISLKARAT